MCIGAPLLQGPVIFLRMLQHSHSIVSGFTSESPNSKKRKYIHDQPKTHESQIIVKDILYRCIVGKSIEYFGSVVIATIIQMRRTLWKWKYNSDHASAFQRETLFFLFLPMSVMSYQYKIVIASFAKKNTEMYRRYGKLCKLMKTPAKIWNVWKNSGASSLPASNRPVNMKPYAFAVNVVKATVNASWKYDLRPL